MINILCIPDAHIKPNVSSERMTWLGKLIIDRKPDVIVCIGDYFDGPSLSSYDQGKKSFEGRKYKDDVKAVIEAQERLFAPLDSYNEVQKSSKRKQYSPQLIMTLGNHENRINRAVESDRKLEGTISVQDLKYEEFGWKVFEYKEPVTIEGITFVHFFPNGLMDKPIAGSMIGKSILQKTFHSGWQGHNHIFNVHTEVDSRGKRIWGGSMGCFLAEGQREDYVGIATQRTWHSGVIYLHDVEDGNFDLEVISIERLKRNYC